MFNLNDVITTEHTKRPCHIEYQIVEYLKENQYAMI